MKKLPYIIIAVLLAVIWFQGCKEQPKPKDKIIIKEVKGEFDPVKEIIHTEIIKVKDPKLKNDIAKLYLENEKLKQNYIDADSLQRELMYLKSIQLNEFYHEFDNDTINIIVKGIAQGEVKQLQPFYTIKQKEIPVSEIKFRFLVGGGIGNSINFDKPLFKANIGVQNTKGNIIRASFDTEQRIIIEYDFSLFKIKKP